MGISLRKLNYFLSVAQQGSFSKAASHLYITQPSLSRQIVDLEKTLGANLFIRSNKGAELTAEGKYLRDHIETIFALVSQIPDGINTAKQNKQTIRIGLPPGLPDEWSLKTFRSLENTFPEISISLYEASTEEQRVMIQSGLLDFGLVHTEPTEIRSALLFHQPFGVAIAPNSILNEKEQIYFTDLDQHQVMCHSDGEISQNETRWRIAAEKAAVDIHWVFRKFSQHSELIAKLSNVEAVLITESSARQNLAGWKWLPIQNKETLEINTQVGTWLAWGEKAELRFPEISSFLVQASPT